LAHVHHSAVYVRDLDASLHFYRDGLGLDTPGIVGTEFAGDDRNPAGAVAMFQLQGGLILALYLRTELAKDATIPLGPPTSGEFSIGHAVAGKAEVDALLGLARAYAAQRRMADAEAAFERAARTNDDVTFLRIDREFNELCLEAARNEFATTAMQLMASLSRRFWYLHYKQAADMPETAKLHADIARGIAAGDADAAGKASDALLDNIEAFTRNTVSTDF